MVKDTNFDNGIPTQPVFVDGFEYVDRSQDGNFVVELQVNKCFPGPNLRNKIDSVMFDKNSHGGSADFASQTGKTRITIGLDQEENIPDGNDTLYMVSHELGHIVCKELRLGKNRDLWEKWIASVGENHGLTRYMNENFPLGIYSNVSNCDDQLEELYGQVFASVHTPSIETKVDPNKTSFAGEESLEYRAQAILTIGLCDEVEARLG